MKSILHQEKFYSSEEIAAELGITVSELFVIAMKYGLLKADGTPTEFGIEQGLVGYIEINNSDQMVNNQ